MTNQKDQPPLLQTKAWQTLQKDLGEKTIFPIVPILKKQPHKLIFKNVWTIFSNSLVKKMQFLYELSLKDSLKKIKITAENIQ